MEVLAHKLKKDHMVAREKQRALDPVGLYNQLLFEHYLLRARPSNLSVSHQAHLLNTVSTIKSKRLSLQAQSCSNHSINY